MRKQIAAANWKMNLTHQNAESLMDDILKKNLSLADHQVAIFGVPFPYLQEVQSKIKNSHNFFAAAQNSSEHSKGAYTGEVSAEMLQSIGINYVIIGHSERRELYSENNNVLAEKVNRALDCNIKPIFCCGEPLHIREANTQDRYVETQLKDSLFHLKTDEVRNFIIAYEPIWAIGTGKTATTQQAQEMHAHIRTVLTNHFGSSVSDSISILYGGSVKASNAKELFGQPDVDGGLVGGASLDAEEFATIIKSLKS